MVGINRCFYRRQPGILVAWIKFSIIGYFTTLAHEAMPERASSPRCGLRMSQDAFPDRDRSFALAKRTRVEGWTSASSAMAHCTGLATRSAMLVVATEQDVAGKALQWLIDNVLYPQDELDKIGRAHV